MSNQGEYKATVGRRSTAQGVVTRHLNTVKKLLQDKDETQVQNCKHQVDKLLAAKSRFDEQHEKALELGFLNAVDTGDIERNGMNLGKEVLMACEEAQAWFRADDEAHRPQPPEGSSMRTAEKEQPEDTTVWRERFEELQKQHTSETKELRSMVASLSQRISDLTERFRDRDDRAVSTPETDVRRRVTFGVSNMSISGRSSHANFGTAAEHMEACQHHAPRMSYGGVSPGREHLEERNFGPPPAHAQSHTVYRPLEAVPEHKESPNYRCSRASGNRESDGMMMPMDLSRRGRETSSRAWFPRGSESLSDASILIQQRLLDQTELHHRSLMASVNSTTAKLSKFDGNPLEYAAFVNAFDELYENVMDNPRAKLSVLLNHCEGRALKVIRWCSHKSAAEGYAEARRTLEQKFGTPFIVSQAWLAKLLGYNSIRTPEELESFACDLVCCRESLSTLGYAGELECTNTLRLIVVKLPIHLRNRWRKVHRESLGAGRGELLNKLIRLVQDASDDINDPAFSERAMEKVKNSYGTTGQPNKVGNPASYRRGGTYSTLFEEKEGDEGEECWNEAALATGGERVTCSACSATNHFTAKCRKYKERSAESKLSLVREKRLCSLCLSSSHGLDQCSLPWRCQEKGCRERHHTSLHGALCKSETQAPSRAQHAVNSLEVHATSDQLLDAECLLTRAMPFLPVTSVKVRSGDHEFETYALLDNASTITLSTKRLAEKLKLEPEGKCTVNLNTVNETSEVVGDMVSFEICGLKMDDFIEVETSVTVGNLPISLDHMARAEELKRWSHLADLDIPCADSSTIDLLIGQDNADILKPKVTVDGNGEKQPYAVLTPVGWTVYGAKGKSRPGKTSASVNACYGRRMNSGPVQKGDVGAAGKRADSKCASEGETLGPFPASALNARKESLKDIPGQGGNDNVSETNKDLRELLEAFWTLDRFPEASRLTKDQKHVMDLWDREVKVVDGHIQLPIPFKKRPPDFPDNFYVARKSLEALGRRLKKNPVKLRKYQVAMKKYFTHRFAEYVKPGDKGRKGWVWYLTHHGIDHDKKPDVTRIVKNGAGKFKGVCLNEVVFQGPDLMNSLWEVLTRFRQYEHATAADIEGMFNMVKVPPEERDCQRFLFWKDGDPDGEIVVCRMTTHIFGTVWAPAAAMYALRKSAEIFGTEFDEDILESIRDDFYVDDWHNSEPTEAKAVRKAKGVDNVVGQASFNLAKFLSTSRAVLGSVKPEKRAKAVQSLDLSKDKLPGGCTLGLRWDPERDNFHFEHVPEPRPETRRGLMSCVASLYDPLGLIAPFTLLAKQMLQQSCREGMGWDDILPQAVLDSWRNWLDDLQELANLKIPRWLGATEDSKNTLHNFGDASQAAYGAAALLVTETVHGDFMDCNLVSARSKLAPLKTQSIPRLELCAATMCVKMDTALRDALTLHLEASYFWTDSMLVMFYILGDPGNYKPFMANRVAFCQESTRRQQWSHVPGELNPADVVSRGAGAEQLIKDNLLYHGPEFLKKRKSEWPAKGPVPKVQDESEMRKSKAIYAITCAVTCEQDGTGSTQPRDLFTEQQVNILGYCNLTQLESIKTEVRDVRTEAEKASLLFKTVEVAASWDCIKRTIAWLSRFAAWYQSNWNGYPRIDEIPRGPLTAAEMIRAEDQLVKMAQKWHIDEGSVKSRAMRSLDPVKEGGVWRVGGRLSNSSLSDEVKRPALVPGKSAIARHIVMNAHERALHSGIDRTVMEVRLKFWVCNVKGIAKKIVSTCVLCRRIRGQPAQQKMGNLPEKRLAFNTPPFYNTGVDLFGPLQVIVRRTTEKRYGVLYTCMCTRAIHIEVAVDLSTSAFLCTFERFTARRGKPDSIQSDNGKNFVGGRAVLKDASEMLKDPKIGKEMASQHIKWTTNSPAASHQGGIWERMIRTTRELMMVVLEGQVVTPDRLHTALCKIEHAVNSRPITKLSDSPESLAPLTPNDILTLRPPKPVFPVKFSGERYKRDYKQAHHLLGEFWDAWIKRYLPDLQKRTKWQQEKKNCYVGELVILIQDQYSRNCWPLGVIKEVYPGRDGLVRNVLVKTKTGEYRRPIQKLIRLEGDLLDTG